MSFLSVCARLLMAQETDNNATSGAPASQSAAAADQQAAAAAKAGRRNWSPSEDKALTQAWLDVSEDPIVGKDQKGQHCWAKVHQALGQNCGPRGSERDLNSCKNRFSVLKAACMKYQGILARMPVQSGASVEDRLARAGEVYEELENSKWTYTHAYVVLKDAPKWLHAVTAAEKTAAATKARRSGQSAPAPSTPSPSTPSTPSSDMAAL